MNFEIYEKYSPPIDSFSAMEFFDDPRINDWIYIQVLKSINFNSKIKIKIKYKKNIKQKTSYKVKKKILNVIFNKINFFIQKYISLAQIKNFL